MWITLRSKGTRGFTPTPKIFGVGSQSERGFTLIELLVVIAIIGILAVVTTVSLTQARRRARDTKRIADVQQIRNALIIYSNARADFPATPDGGGVLGGNNAGCIDDDGFHARGGCDDMIIMERVPSEQVADYIPYTYTRIGPNGYTIRFSLEGAVGDLNGGICTADENIIQCE